MSTAPSRSSSSARTRCSSVIGRSDADKREREAARIAETIAAHHAEAEQHRAAAAAAAAEKREIAGDAEAFAKLAARIRGHELEAERLELLAERLAGELEQVRAEAAQARWREARDAEEAAGARAREASAKFARSIAAAVRDAQALERAREAADAARSRQLASRPVGADGGWPEHDEPDWPDPARLVTLLQAGPRQPRADSKRAAEAVARQVATSRAATIRQAVEDAVRGGPHSRWRLEQLPHDLRAEAERRLAAVAAYRTHVPRVDDDVVRRLIGGQNVPGLPRRVAQALAGGDAPERAVGETGPLVAAS